MTWQRKLLASEKVNINLIIIMKNVAACPNGFPPFVPCKCDSGLGSGSVVRIPDPLILQPIHLGPGPVNPSSASHNVITSHSHITPRVFKHELTFALKLFLAIDSPYLPTNHINHNMSKVGWGSAFICTDSSFGCNIFRIL